MDDDRITSLDKELNIDVDLPKVIKDDLFDQATVSLFQTIADETGGELYKAENAEMIVETISEIINSHCGDDVDLCFLIDKTENMVDDIKQIQSSLEVIFKAIQRYKNVRVALAYYGDKNIDGDQWIEIHDFTKNYASLEKRFKMLKYSGGGDKPESMTDAAFITVNNLTWTSTKKRIMLVLGDAPSLEQPLAQYTMNDLVKQSKSSDIVSNYYPVVVDFGPYSTRSSDIATTSKMGNMISAIYPNPADFYINILLEKEDQYAFEIFDLSGRLVRTENQRTQKIQMNVDELDNGVYIVRVKKEDGTNTQEQRIIVQH